MTAILNEHQQWVTNGGIPIVNGRVYFGVVNQDPKANPITIYSDRLLTSVLANPQPTDSNGRTINKVWVDGQYSLKLENSTGSQLYQQLDFGSDFVGGIISLKNIQGANTIVSNAIPFLTSLVDGQLFELTLAQTNTGDVTLKIDSQVAKPVLKNHTQQINAGEFEATQKSVVIYNGTDDVFEWVNQNTGGLSSVQVFTADGTWTKPAGIISIRAQLVGGGAGGSSVSNPNTGAGGGGAGGYSEGIFDVAGTSSEIATIGIGGTGGPGGTGTFGGAGGMTSLGSLLSATGGIINSVNFGGTGGVGSDGDINIDGGDGSAFTISGVGGTGGASYFGGGTTGTNILNARDSMVPGAGGGGGGDTGGVSGDGGNGGAGIIIVWEYS